MGRPSETKEIDGFVFTIHVLPGTQGTLLSRRLMQIAAPAVLKALGGAKDLNLSNLDLGGLSEGARLLFDALSEEEFKKLMKTLFEGGTLETEGNKFPLMQVLDLKLAGKVPTIYKAIWFALQVNFGNFSDLRDAIRSTLAGMVVVAPPSVAPTT